MLRATSGLANGGTFNNPTFTGVVTGVPYKLAQFNVMVGIAPSGTMGNNGAVTFGTALPTTFSQGLWLLYPAGAVATGVPASATMLWTVMSSSTVGTVYNSSFDGSTTPSVGSTTAFATTGPGAFTGVTSATTLATVTVAANTLGTNGSILVDWTTGQNTAAGNKAWSIFYSTTGGTDYANVAFSNQGDFAGRTVIRNNGVTNFQSGFTFGAVGVGTGVGRGGGAMGYGSADTTGSTTIVFRGTNATATNYMLLSGATVLVSK